MNAEALTRKLRWVSVVALGSAGLLVIATGCPLQPGGGGGGGGDGGTGNSGVTGKFVGAERCSLCHSRVHAEWTETLHAGALETLEAIGQGSNAACLPCHTVGFGQEGGFCSSSS